MKNILHYYNIMDIHYIISKYYLHPNEIYQVRISYLDKRKYHLKKKKRYFNSIKN